MRQHTKRSEWESRVSEWQKSGKSARVWCEENQIVYVTFLGWRNRLRPNQNLSDTSEFIELQEELPRSSGISLECSGVLIHLSLDFNTPTLKKCLEVLRGESC